MSPTRRPGDVVGPFTLIELLQETRNSDVWRVRKGTRSDIALKILKTRRTDSEAYRRFRAEIQIMSRISDEPGVLPLLEYGLPEVPSKQDPAWLATPVASPIRESLSNERLDVVIGAMAHVARTLARLAERRVFHRDIKPENLFHRENEWEVGDFGLATFPDKETITEEGGKLGPWWYMAPEMRDRPHDADPGPADVHSLVKTLWVLATGQNFPPPGEQRLDTPNVRIGAYVDHPRVHLLDRLVESGTRHDSNRRPSMADVADELEAWVRPLPTEEIRDENLGELEARIRQYTGGASDEVRMQREAQEAAGTLYTELLETIRPLASRIDAIGVPAALQSDNTFVTGYLLRGDTFGAPVSIYSDGAAVVAQPSASGPTLWLGFGIKAFDDGSIDVVAGAMLGALHFPQDEVWIEERSFPVGSAQQQAAVRELVLRLLDIRPTLEAYADLLSRRGPSPEA